MITALGYGPETQDAIEIAAVFPGRTTKPEGRDRQRQGIFHAPLAAEVSDDVYITIRLPSPNPS